MGEVRSFNQPDSFEITFLLSDCEVGALKMKDGHLTFEGNADESAQIFFDTVVKKYYAELQAIKK